MTTNIYDNIYENNMKTENYFVKVKLLSTNIKVVKLMKNITQVQHPFIVQHPFMFKSFKSFMYT